MFPAFDMEQTDTVPCVPHAMIFPRIVRTLAPALLLTIAASGAQAGTVKGAVRLPDGARTGRQFQGYWRLENGNVPIRGGGSKAGTVVVIDGLSGVHAPPAKTVTIEISGLEMKLLGPGGPIAQPGAVVVGPGSVIEFKNVGRVTHELSTPANPSIMQLERLTPGTFRHQKFGVPGAYIVRCAEYPHLAISVIVVDTPYFAVVDDKGTFSIPSVPDGKATLKVWSQGRWAHEEPIDTASKQDLTVRVTAPKGAKEPEAKDPDAKETEGGGPEGKETDSKGSAE